MASMPPDSGARSGGLVLFASMYAVALAVLLASILKGVIA